MKKIWIVAKKEYKSYFNSPVAYVTAAVILLVVGLIFSSSVERAVAQPGNIPGTDVIASGLVFMLVFTTPAITMRLISDETRMGTIELLLTAPAKDWEIVIGKWLGAYLFLLSVIGTTLIYPIILNNVATPGIDQGLMSAGYLSMALMAAAYCAIGLLISAMFNNVVASFLLTMGTFVFLWFLLPFFTQFSRGRTFELLNDMNFQSHYYGIATGSVGTIDLMFFGSVVVFCLTIASVLLESRRWR